MGVDQLVTGGDFDDPVVDSLTSDSVNADDLLYGESRKEVKQVASFDEDTDGSTNLDLEVSVNVTDRAYEYEIVFVLSDPPSASGDLLLRFNGGESTSYDQVTINGSSFDGGTEFQTGIGTTVTRKRFSLHSNFRPNIRELTQSESAKSIARAKSRAVEGDELSTIQLFTDGLSCAGRAYVVEVSDQ